MEAVSLKKYPRTPHLEGSRLQPGDEDLSQVPFSYIKGKHLVVEAASRMDAVPEQAIGHMMEELVLPEVQEAHKVQWRTI